jgi:hypothetical protein
MEFLEKYHCPINYHPGKANLVVNALSCKVRMVRLRIQEFQPVQEMLKREVEVQGEKIHVSNLKVTADLRQGIQVAQTKDNDFQTLRTKMLGKGESDFREDENGALYFHDCICVLESKTLRKQILEEVHRSKYAIHPGEVKMHQDLRGAY